MYQPTKEERILEVQERELLEYYALIISEILQNIYNLKETKEEEFSENMRKEYLDLLNIFNIASKKMNDFYENNYKNN